MITIEKIKLKRSDDIHKRPTADELDYGEVTINYNSENAFLAFKDNEGNVQIFEEILNVNEDGFYIGADNNDVILKYDYDGFDVAKVSEHFLSLIDATGIKEIIDVAEDGFYIGDENNYVALSLINGILNVLGLDQNVINYIKNNLPSPEVIVDASIEEKQVGTYKDTDSQIYPMYERTVKFVRTLNGNSSITETVTTTGDIDLEKYCSIQNFTASVAGGTSTIDARILTIASENNQLTFTIINNTVSQHNNAVIEITLRYVKKSTTPPEPDPDFDEYTIQYTQSGTILPTIEVSPTKYAKDHVVMFTADDASASHFSTFWAACNHRPIPQPSSDPAQNVGSYYHVNQMDANDFPVNAVSFDKPLCSTDGCGNDIRWRVGCAVWPNVGIAADGSGKANMDSTNAVGSGFRFKGAYLQWNDVKRMVDFGCGIMQHNVNQSKWGSTPTSAILNGYAEDTATTINRVGRKMRAMAEPDGNLTYIEASQQYPDHVIMTCQNGGHGGVELKKSDILTIQPKFNLIRHFGSGSADIFANINQKLNSNTEYVIHEGLHTASADWANSLYDLNTVHGKGGADDIWMTTLTEMYDYSQLAQKAIIEKSISGNTVTLKVKVPKNMPETYYKELTLFVHGSQSVSSVSTSANVYGLSYGSNPKVSDGTMFNLNLGSDLLEKAQKYTTILESVKTAIAKEDALYFVNRLAAGSTKTALLTRVNNVIIT